MTTFSIDFYNSVLYKNSDINTSINFKGKNHKSITIFCRNELNQEDFDFLSKILNAVNLDIENDVSLFSLSEKNIHFAEINRTIEIDKLLFFGIKSDEIGLHLNLRPYQIASWSGIEILLSESIEDLKNNKQKKQFLWSALQKMFLI